MLHVEHEIAVEYGKMISEELLALSVVNPSFDIAQTVAEEWHKNDIKRGILRNSKINLPAAIDGTSAPQLITPFHPIYLDWCDFEERFLRINKEFLGKRSKKKFPIVNCTFNNNIAKKNLLWIYDVFSLSGAQNERR